MASLMSRSWSVCGQAGTRHLGRGGDGQIGRFFPDLLKRLIGVALYLLTGLGQAGLGLHAGLLEDLGLAGLPGLARPLDDGVGLAPAPAPAGACSR